jgi:hypothetical protein
MLVVISPAKKLDWSEEAANVHGFAPTAPAFQQDAVYLAGVAAKLSPDDLRKLMSISAPLAELNQARFRAFAADPAPEDLRPALRAFAGDTYQGLHAQSLDADAVTHAQDHLRILSGLYGLLRPLDGMQPYRLEMGSRLKTREGKSLYAYWGSRIADALSEQAADTGSEVLVNCASKEYFGAVDQGALAPRVITPAFVEERGGDIKVISFHAKRARGAMARFIVENRLTDTAALRDFEHAGYRYDPVRSTPDAPVFLRPETAQAAA